MTVTILVKMENGRLLKTRSSNGEVSRKRTRQWMVGLVYLVIVAFIWTFSSVLVQYIFTDMGFKGPFFLTYVATSLFSINLPLWWLFRELKWTPSIPLNDRTPRTHASRNEIYRISRFIAPIWFIANFTYNQSLGMTSVTSSTVVSSTSSIFTFLLSLTILNEHFSAIKLIGVLCCMMGNITTVWKDTPSSNGPSDNAFGDLVALIGAVSYGAYTVAFRHHVPNDEYANIPLFFGYLGLINAIVLFPVVLFLHWTQIEPLDGLTWEIFGLLVLKGLFDNVLSDYLWAKAVVLTSPTVATIGLSLTIPMAIVSDAWIHHIAPDTATYFASFFVVCGFVLINITSKQEPEKINREIQC